MPSILYLTLRVLTFICFVDQINTHPTGTTLERERQDEYGRELSQRQNIDQFYTYLVDANAATQATNIQAKQEAGYRIISLSVYGDPTNPLYSTVWSNRPTAPTYLTLFTNNTSEFAGWVGSNIASGWTASLVSAAGSATNPQWAVVMEKLPNVATSMFRLGMVDGNADTAGTFENVNNQAYSDGLSLKSMSIYGGPNNRRWVAIWQSNPNLVETRYHFGDAEGVYPQTVTTETSLPGYRPVSISLDSDQTYSSLWANSRLASSTQWQHQYGLSHAGLLQAIQTGASSGLAPISIAGGGSSTNSNTVYALVLAPTDVIDTRVMKAPVGSVNSTYFANPTNAVAEIHDQIQGFMYQYRVRFAQVSIKKNGQPRMDWAYAYTELNNCVPFKCSVSPSDKFLLASNSKIFCAAAINLLLQKGQLSLSQSVFGILGYVPASPIKGKPSQPNQPIDSRYLEITVEQCLNHQGGWNLTNSGFDPLFAMRQIALDENSNGSPATTLEIIQYMADTYTLDYDPGSGTVYSNFGYLVLSAVVAKVSGMSYYQFVYNEVLVPSGVNLAQISEWQTAEANRPAGEITQESYLTGLPALSPTSGTQVPVVYSGDGMIKEVATGTTDITCSMDVLSRFIGKNAVWGWGGRSIGIREGTTDGAWTYSESRTDGVDWALAFNTRDWINAQYSDSSSGTDLTPENFAASLNLTITNWEIS